MAPGRTGQRIAVVGAGPVGALAALYAARRGDQVEIYELRGDLRDASTVPLNFTKSINLALSERGIYSMSASQSVGLVDNVMAETIPMFGRMIHGRDSSGGLQEKSQKYDIHGRAIRAVDRRGLNVHLLDALEQLPNVHFFFNHKLTGADFRRRKAWFENRADFHPAYPHARAPEIEVDFDFLIGADGAHSAARFHLMKYARVSYEQQYIDTLWCEFRISPRNGAYAMSPNHLHIWPGRDFMFIAIPSLDRSFTCTLFAPQRTFAQLASRPSSLPDFFNDNFPGVSPEQIDPKELIEQFRTNPHLPLINIKCNPYHYESSVVILGDAAHAMVPFYGQGMNAGLEDVRVLFEILDNSGVYSSQTASEAEHARGVALQKYTDYRGPDAFTINELALRNYLEMRSGVVSPVYLVRKFVEETVSTYFPQLRWATQYSRVSFGNERYSEVVKAVRRQGQILLGGVAVTLSILLLLLAIMWARAPIRLN